MVAQFLEQFHSDVSSVWGGGVGEVGSREDPPDLTFWQQPTQLKAPNLRKFKWKKRSALVSYKIIFKWRSQSCAYPALLEASPCPVQCKRDVGKALAA